MPLIAAAFAAMAVAMRFVVGRLIVGVQMQVARQKAGGEDETNVRDAIYEVFQTVTIIQNAILEGAAFFVLVMFLLFGQSWLLGVAAALVALMLVTFPTKGRIEHFIDEHKQQWEFEGDR